MNSKALPLPLPEIPSVERRDRPLAPVKSTDVPHPVRRPERRRVWIALHFPSWPLHAALSKLPELERKALTSQPCATVDDDRRRRVLACNEVAQKSGVRFGHTLNASIALCPQMHFFPRDRVQEAQLLTQTARLFQAYTPVVSIEEPDELLLEVRGSCKLFGSLQSLMDRIEGDLMRLSLNANTAVSPTPESALWFARTGSAARRIVPPRELRAALSSVPLAALRWPMDIELRLFRFGVRTIGDLLRLPRGGLARRIGIDRLKELDQAIGRQPSLRKPLHTAETYVDRVPLDFEIETTTLLGIVLLRCLERLADFLRRRELTIGELVVDLVHREQKVTPLHIGLARSTANVSHLGTLIHETLNHLTLAAPVREIVVKVERLLPPMGIAGDLFYKDQHGAATHEERKARLIEQFHSRLGDKAPWSLQAVADHRPECAQRHHRLTLSNEPRQAQPPERLPRRPLWLLHEPRLVSRDGRDSQPFAIVSGPESIELGWWDQRFIDRDYFIAHSRQGSLWWVFSERARPGHWYLHGVFG